MVGVGDLAIGVRPFMVVMRADCCRHGEGTGGDASMLAGGTRFLLAMAGHVGESRCEWCGE